MSFRRRLSRFWRYCRVRFFGGRRKPVLSLTVERRRFPRVRSHNLIRFLGRSGMGSDFLFNLADLSEGGFRIWTELDMGRDALMEAVVNLREQALIVPVTLRMIWRRPAQYPRGGQIGAETLDLTEECRHALRQLVLKKLFLRHAA